MIKKITAYILILAMIFSCTVIISYGDELSSAQNELDSVRKEQEISEDGTPAFSVQGKDESQGRRQKS